MLRIRKIIFYKKIIASKSKLDYYNLIDEFLNFKCL